MGEMTLVYFTLTALFLLGGWAGYGLHNYLDVKAYNERAYESNYSGLHLTGFENHSSAINKAYEYEPSGDWVCVNTKKATFQEIYQTCVHECTHYAYSEILSEKCESNMTKCADMFDVLAEQL